MTISDSSESESEAVLAKHAGTYEELTLNFSCSQYHM